MTVLHAWRTCEWSRVVADTHDGDPWLEAETRSPHVQDVRRRRFTPNFDRQHLAQRFGAKHRSVGRRDHGNLHDTVPVTHDQHRRRRGELQRDEQRRDHRAARHARDFALGVAFALGIALVVQLLSLAERERHLGHSVLEVELERDERQSLTLDRADHPTDFLAVEQQFPRPGGLVVE